MIHISDYRFKIIASLKGQLVNYLYIYLYIQEEETQNVEMTVCLQKGSLPITSSGVQCAADRHFLVTRQEGKPGLLYIPYVESAMWYLAAQVDCYNNQTGQAEECEKNAALEFDVSITPCVDGGCNGNGFCREYFSGIIHYTSCACIASEYRQSTCTSLMAGICIRYHPTQLYMCWSYHNFTHCHDLTAQLLYHVQNLMEEHRYSPFECKT